MKTYTVYLFRHGLTKGNINAQYIGHTDFPLTTDGINQLKSIKAKYHYPEVEAVFVSPLKRAMQSADIMFPKNNKIVIDNLIYILFLSDYIIRLSISNDRKKFIKSNGNVLASPSSVLANNLIA